jgi:hypothetical protein
MNHECVRASYPSSALCRWEFERHGEAMRVDVPGSLTLDYPGRRHMAASLRAFVDPAQEIVSRNRAKAS